MTIEVGREERRTAAVKARRQAGGQVTAKAVNELDQQETDLGTGGEGNLAGCGEEHGSGRARRAARGRLGELDRQPSPDRATLRGEGGPGGRLRSSKIGRASRACS